MEDKSLTSTTFLGKCNFRGNDKIFGIKQQDRRQHTYVMGKTGTGKTTLLENMVLQDIHAGRGVGVIDPHGEFVDRLLDQIPQTRMNDVVYVNPVDMDYPIGFNVLEVPDQKYKHLVVSDLLGIFTKIWANVWSARMEYILQNCIMALLDTPGTTLLGVPRILVDKNYREKIVANVKDPVVKSFWVHEYETWRDQFRNEAIVPIQNKVGQFLNTGFIRNMVGQPKSTLNVTEVMNMGKILLVNVSKGKVGEDNSALLGAMIITKIQLAAMERVRIYEEDRKDFYLYVDEFQNFATDSFASILSEARKYRLNLIIAHQYVGQLVTDVSTKVRDAVFGNVGTMIVFRVGAGDAEFLEPEFTPEFMQADLISLPNHTIYLKLMVEGLTSRPFSAATLPPLKFDTSPGTKEQMIQGSRNRYARPRVEVEEMITRWTGIGESDDGGGGFVSQATGGSGSTPASFEAQCWNCGKMSTLPFKPDGKRPVYCLSCLKQIEEGKLIPLPQRMPQVGRVRFSESLHEVGIEFAAKPQAREGAPMERRQESRRDDVRPTPPSSRIGRERDENRPPSAGASSAPRGGSRSARPEFSRSDQKERPRFQNERRGDRHDAPRREDNRKPFFQRSSVQPSRDQSVSLSSLAPRGDKIGPEKQERIPPHTGVRQRQAPDTSNLRKALGEFLTQKPAERITALNEQKSIAEPLHTDSAHDHKKKSPPFESDGNVIQPGQSIRL